MQDLTLKIYDLKDLEALYQLMQSPEDRSLPSLFEQGGRCFGLC